MQQTSLYRCDRTGATVLFNEMSVEFEESFVSGLTVGIGALSMALARRAASTNLENFAIEQPNTQRQNTFNSCP